jgi:hypothetical protein
MRYGPNTDEVTAFLSWLEELDADRVRVVLEKAPMSPQPERRAALDEAFATGLPANVFSALDKDKGPAFLALTEREVFANLLEKTHFWTTVGVTLRAIAARGKLEPSTVDLLLEPFRAAGFVFAPLADPERP